MQSVTITYDALDYLRARAQVEAAKPDAHRAFMIAASDLVSLARKSIAERIGESAYADLAAELETLEMFGRMP